MTRRDFLRGAAAAAAWPLQSRSLNGQTHSTGSRIFRHGVASGDPLRDRVILWTRVTPATQGSTADAVEVEWRLARDEALAQTVRTGTERTSAERDFTIKVDATGLESGRPYFFAFDAHGERSPVGRTRTLPDSTDRVRLASVSCSNYPAGYFNVYRCLADRADIDAVLHLGDYIYEFENGRYGDGTNLLRLPDPPYEAVTLSDYRRRYATYRTDPDLQAVHQQHPFIVVWDDHELTNDAWSGGAANHNPETGEGDWAARRAAAYRAYVEWMPIREPDGDGIRLYRSFRFGDLVDLLMLDTRGLRDAQVAGDNMSGLSDARRTLLGPAQEAWLLDQLRASQHDGVGWRVLGQQVMFSRLSMPDRAVPLPDAWDGYQAARERVLDAIVSEKIRDLAILSADVHSSWAFDVVRNPWSGYTAQTGEGSLGVELIAPAVSSPPLFSDPVLRERAPLLRALLPHLKWLEGDSRGYVLVDVTRQELRADWYFVPSVLERTAAETRAQTFVCQRGSSRLAAAT